MPMVSSTAPKSGKHLRAAVDAKCRNCGGQEGGKRYWRLHVSACPVTNCPLWRVRPIASRHSAEWLTSRDPERLPTGFQDLATEDAIELIRSDTALMSTEKADNSVIEFDMAAGASDAPE